jgi:large conductance mechanosensitive channel
VLPLNYLMAKSKKPEAEAAPTTKTCGECLSEIPLSAKRCKFCTQAVA